MSNKIQSPYDHPLRYHLSQIRKSHFRCDFILLLVISLLAALGLFILYSASNENMGMVQNQAMRLLLGMGLMLALAQISPERYQQWSPWLYFAGLFLLVSVLIIGHVGQGARRWIDLGFFRFQPSEIMKLAMPMMLAWFFSNKTLPPSFKYLLMSSLILLIPVLLTAKQPDLGTAIIIFSSGFCVLLLAGLGWRILLGLTVLGGTSFPILWHFMHHYQKERVMTFLNPERDPLGSGYHIIQSKIAIGSGGFLGKGWLHGTQSHLSFLPAHATDFIFAVSSEELGLLGSLCILTVLMLVLARCLYISNQASSNFTRLLAGSLSLTFIISAFVNIGMVIGVLPVVGVPLPLISYGGSSIVTTMVSFGIIMSIQTHKKLWST